MVLDILVGGIVIFMMVLGFRQGFTFTFINMAGWIISILAAFLLTPKVNYFLFEKTGIHQVIYENLYIKFTSAMSLEDLSYGNLPSSVEKAADLVTDGAAETMADSLANLLFSIISFVIVILCIKLILYIVIKIVSRTRKIKFVGFIDGLVGLFFGFIKGVLLASILLALLVPFSITAAPSISKSISQSLDKSVIAGELYENNLVLLVFNNI